MSAPVLTLRQRIDTVLAERFADDTTIMTATGGRFWPDAAPEGEAYPRIVWVELTNANTRVVEGIRFLDRTTIWIDCVSNEPRSRKSADELFAAVNAIVERLSDYSARPHILKAIQQSQRRFVDPRGAVRYNHSGAVYVFHGSAT